MSCGSVILLAPGRGPCRVCVVAVKGSGALSGTVELSRLESTGYPGILAAFLDLKG